MRTIAKRFRIAPAQASADVEEPDPKNFRRWLCGSERRREED
jgi:hypothetical protein